MKTFKQFLESIPNRDIRPADAITPKMIFPPGAASRGEILRDKNIEKRMFMKMVPGFPFQVKKQTKNNNIA